MISHPFIFSFFFFNDTATTEIYTLSLHDALPILILLLAASGWLGIGPLGAYRTRKAVITQMFATARTQAERGEYEHLRSEEHTSELQSPDHLVCRLLLEKKKKKKYKDEIIKVIIT